MLHVVRKQVKCLCFKHTLGHNTVMTQGLTISNFERVTIGARFSKADNAMTKSGDFVSNEISVYIKEKVTI